MAVPIVSYDTFPHGLVDLPRLGTIRLRQRLRRIDAQALGQAALAHNPTAPAATKRYLHTGKDKGAA